MKHKFRFTMINSYNNLIYEESEFERTHNWDFKANLTETRSHMSIDEQLKITLIRRKTVWLFGKKNYRFGEAKIAIDEMISPNGTDVVDIIQKDYKSSSEIKKAKMTIKCE